MTKKKTPTVNANEATPEGGIILKGPFPESEIPSRTRPLEYYDDLRAALSKLQKPSDTIELDNQKITEHRARRYLRLLAQEDASYKSFRLRTAPSDEGHDGRATGKRRRVFIVRGALS
jgi:hypothetical protein